MAIEKRINVRLETSQAKKELNVLKQDIESSADVTEQIGKNAEGSVPGFQKLTVSTKAFGTALKATGIGLVVGAFVKLQEALGRNQTVMDTFNTVTETISITFQQLVTRIVDATQKTVKFFNKVGSVIKKFIKKDLDGLTSAYEENNEQVESSIQRNRRLAKEIVELRKEVKLAEAEQRLLQLTYEKEAEIQRQIRDDINLTFDERIEANRKLGQILDDQFAEEEALAQKKVELAEKELSQNQDNIDLQVALINAQADLADLEQRITTQRSEQLINLTSLQNEYNDSVKKFGQLQQKTIIDGSKKVLDADVDAMNQRLKHHEFVAPQILDIEELTAENKRAIVAHSLGQISQLLGEESKAAKALSVAQAIINTYSAANAALSSPPVGAGPLWGIPVAVGAVAAGMANVRQIMSTKLPGVSDITSPDTSTPNVPSATGGIGGLIPNMESIEGVDMAQQPVQAFVVENDISNAQALQEELEIQATL
jgi:hypothetical protein